MLERTVEANFAKAAFFEHINDVDVYIEDTDELTKKLIATLVGRALGGQVRLDTVFPLGGRDAVIDACAVDQDSVGRRRVFIVDGDFSFWSCYSYIKLRRLFVLNKYCIENYLFDKDSIISLVFEESADKDFQQIEGELDFDRWGAVDISLLIRLFKAYAISHRFAPEVPTVARPARDFVKDGVGSVDEAKVDAVIGALKMEVDAIHGHGFFDRELLAIEHACAGRRLIDGVSGKDYLMPILLIRMRSMAKIKSTNASVMVRLASRCKFDGIERIIDVIEA